MARARAARDVGHVQVLLGDALGGVDQDERDVGAARGLERAHLAPELDLLALRAVAAQAGRVDQAVDAVAALEADVDRVARRARDLADDRALLVAERVQQRRLADVRAAEDDDADLVGRALDARDVERAQALDDLVEQVARARCRAAPRARTGRRARARGTRAPRRGGAGLSSLLATSSTGTRERRRRSASSRSAGAGRGRGVDEQQHEVGLGDRELGLADDLALERARRRPRPRRRCRSARTASPPHSTTSCLRSRVTPGSECTTVSRVAVRRLTSVDLPAFGSPTIATVPSSVRSVCASASARALPRAARARGFVAHASPRASTPARSRGRPAAMAACVRRCRRSSSRCSSAVVATTASR